MAKSQTLIPEISLFLPAYNEEGNIAETVTQANKVLNQIADNYEILVVEDGSRDNTAKIVDDIIKKNKHVRMVRHNPNRGYGGALRTGFEQTKYDPVVFIDSDGQFDFSEVTKLISKMQETSSDLVVGYRLKRNDHPLRLAIASLLKVWNLFWFGMWVKDTDCAFKLIRRHVIRAVSPLKSNGGIISTEFLAKVRHQGFKMAQVGVHHYPRKAGKSTGGDPKVILKAIKETFSIWQDINLQSN